MYLGPVLSCRAHDSLTHKTTSRTCSTPVRNGLAFHSSNHIDRSARGQKYEIMAKKRKDPPQATTLHNFFAAGSVQASSSPNVVKRSRSDTPVQRQRKDVIVIDSDEEENSTRPPLISRSVKGKERASSSDVEIVEISLRTTPRLILSPSPKENGLQTTRGRSRSGDVLGATTNNAEAIDVEAFEWENALNDDELDLIPFEVEDDEKVEDLLGDVHEALESPPEECCPVCSVSLVGWEAKVRHTYFVVTFPVFMTMSLEGYTQTRKLLYRFSIYPLILIWFFETSIRVPSRAHTTCGIVVEVGDKI